MATLFKSEPVQEVVHARPTGETVDLAAFARKMQRRYPKILKRLGE